MVEEVAKGRLAGKLRLAAERLLVARAEADVAIRPGGKGGEGVAAKIAGGADALAKLASQWKLAWKRNAVAAKRG